MTETTQGALSELPRLPACTIVESKLASRREIAAHVMSSGLFAQVCEAESVQHALILFGREKISAVVIGPAVSPPKVAEFINKSRNIPAADDCAFLALLTPDNPEGKTLHESGVHTLVGHPYRPEDLHAHIVQAVVAAHPDGPWAQALAQRADGDSPDNSNGSRQHGEPVRTIEPRAYVDALKNSIPALAEMAAGHQQGEYALTLDGTPNAAATARLKELIQEVMNAAGISQDEHGSFAEFLDWAFTRWFIEMVLSSEQMATLRLRRVLASFSARAKPR